MCENYIIDGNAVYEIDEACMRKKNGCGCRCERSGQDGNYEYEKAEATEIEKKSENDVVVSVCSLS